LQPGLFFTDCRQSGFERDVRRTQAQKEQAECRDPGGIEKIQHAHMMPDKSKFASVKLT
jgi:hypothetical protein